MADDRGWSPGAVGLAVVIGGLAGAAMTGWCGTGRARRDGAAVPLGRAAVRAPAAAARAMATT